MDRHINSPTRLAHPVLLDEHQNTVLASFPDVPEALTEGATEQEALEEAVDCLVASLGGYVKGFSERIGVYPHGPVSERLEIARHACARSSGRVGRSAAARELDEWAIDLAVQAHVRHRHTTYDELLVQGIDRQDARGTVAMEVNRVLTGWRDGIDDTGVR